MSLVIAVKKGDTVYFGADTQTTCGISKRNMLKEFNYKVQKLPGGLLLSTTGSVKGKHLCWRTPKFLNLTKRMA